VRDEPDDEENDPQDDHDASRRWLLSGRDPLSYAR
jgi:hypothetical protein